jgi:hypothetical protein
MRPNIIDNGTGPNRRANCILHLGFVFPVPVAYFFRKTQPHPHSLRYASLRPHPNLLVGQYVALDQRLESPKPSYRPRAPAQHVRYAKVLGGETHPVKGDREVGHLNDGHWQSVQGHGEKRVTQRTPSFLVTGSTKNSLNCSARFGVGSTHSCSSELPLLRSRPKVIDCR